MKTPAEIKQKKRALVSHSFVFVYMREFGYYILFGACRNEGNSCEKWLEITKRTFKNTTYYKKFRFRFTVQYQ